MVDPSDETRNHPKQQMCGDGIGLSQGHIIAGARKGIQGLIKSPFMIGSNSMSTPKVLTFHHMLAYPQTSFLSECDCSFQFGLRLTERNTKES